MRRTAAEKIVEFLSFSDGTCDRATELTNFSQRDWERVRRWLNDAGLAFYFLQKLKDTHATDNVPTSVISGLERDFAANRERMDDMSHRFGVLNEKFLAAGVRYAVVKGFSLVPQFCPQAHLRYQCDLDYLVDEPSLAAAQRALLDAGYRPKSSRSSQEFIFVMPGTREASRSAQQYDARAPHAVELHLDIWDNSLNGQPFIPNLFYLERARTYRWNGFTFPALADDDAFLLDVLHACQHFFSYWIRMSALYEIGYFLNRRSSDAALWDRVEQRVGDNAVLRESVVIVAELANQLFASPLPPLIRNWGSAIRPGPRVWIESYARRWAFCDLPVHQFSLFPSAKLALFLQREYREKCSQKLLVRDRAFSLSPLLDRGWWKRRRSFQRTVFHALAGLRYVCEIPRWRWLNRARTRSAALNM